MHSRAQINIIYVLFSFLGACQHKPLVLVESQKSVSSCLTEHRVPSMGTFFELQLVHVCGYNPDSEILVIKKHLDEIEADLSLYQTESEISKLNREGRLCTSSPHLLKLVKESKVFFQKTDGAFDITILPVLREIETSFKEKHHPPKNLERFRSLVNSEKIRIEGNCIEFQNKGMAITLDGIAKGYAVDEAAGFLSSSIHSYLLNFSGNMLWRGEKPEGPWKIAVWNPKQQVAIPIAVSDQGAIASSGPENAYFDFQKKWHHIINPKTLRPSRSFIATTALGRSAMECDVLSTSIMNLDQEQSQRIQKTYFSQQSFWFVNPQGKVILRH